MQSPGLLYPNDYYYASITLEILSSYTEFWNHIIDIHFNLTLSFTNFFAPTVLLLFAFLGMSPLYLPNPQGHSRSSHVPMEDVVTQSTIDYIRAKPLTQIRIGALSMRNLELNLEIQTAVWLFDFSLEGRTYKFISHRIEWIQINKIFNAFLCSQRRMSNS